MLGAQPLTVAPRCPITRRASFSARVALSSCPNNRGRVTKAKKALSRPCLSVLVCVMADHLQDYPHEYVKTEREGVQQHLNAVLCSNRPACGAVRCEATRLAGADCAFWKVDRRALGRRNLDSDGYTRSNWGLHGPALGSSAVSIIKDEWRSNPALMLPAEPDYPEWENEVDVRGFTPVR